MPAFGRSPPSLTRGFATFRLGRHGRIDAAFILSRCASEAPRKSAVGAVECLFLATRRIKISTSRVLNLSFTVLHRRADVALWVVGRPRGHPKK